MIPLHKLMALLAVLAACTFQSASAPAFEAAPETGTVDVPEAAGPRPPSVSPPESSSPGTRIPTTTPPGQEHAPRPIRTPTAILEATPSPEPIYQDTFTSQNLWFTGEEEGFTFAYVDGRYQVSVHQLNTAVWSVREAPLGDVFLEVEARRVSGAEHALFGLVCRFMDRGNYYALLLDDTGMAAIHRYENGRLRVLARLEPEQVVPLSSGAQRLGAGCQDTVLSLSVNGQEILSVRDEALLVGSVGVSVVSVLDAGVVVDFDNFKAYRP